MSNFLKLVGNRVREIRKMMGLTQEELAERAGLQYTYIGGIERGERNVSLDTLEKIINALNISPTELFKFDKNEIKNETKNKERLIEGYKALLVNRDLEEIKVVHKVVKDILYLLDSQKEHK